MNSTVTDGGVTTLEQPTMEFRWLSRREPVRSVMTGRVKGHVGERTLQQKWSVITHKSGGPTTQELVWRDVPTEHE